MKEIKDDFLNGFKSFGLNFNALINLIVLSLVYLIGIGPSSVVAKVLGKHFLELKSSPQRKSYWVKFDAGAPKISNFLRQF